MASLEGGAEPTRIRANRLINAAGLGAQDWRRFWTGSPELAFRRLTFCQGQLFLVLWPGPIFPSDLPDSRTGRVGKSI